MIIQECIHKIMSIMYTTTNAMMRMIYVDVVIISNSA